MFTILYSPQPDEQPDSSAAYEYAKRASDMISQHQQRQQTVAIHRLSLDSLDMIGKQAAAASLEDEEKAASCTIIILSCSADGSVDRIVRKIIRNMKNQENNKDDSSKTDQSTSERVVTVLLGHARCDNSANQMKDTIFNYGRKFHKCIEQLQSVSSSNSTANTSVRERLEVQVELEGPDVPGGFDEWVVANSK
eukprot:scaffold16946_cov80-Skeletonema_marinoi.AAC.1